MFLDGRKDRLVEFLHMRAVVVRADRRTPVMAVTTPVVVPGAAVPRIPRPAPDDGDIRPATRAPPEAG